MVLKDLERQSKKFEIHRNRTVKTDWLSLEQDIRDALQVYKDANGFSSPGEHGVVADSLLSFISDSLGWHTGRGYVLESK